MPEQIKYNKDSFDAQTATILSKLDALHEDVKDIKKENHDVRRRLSALENYKYFLTGGVTFISVMASYIFNIFIKKS